MRYDADYSITRASDENFSVFTFLWCLLLALFLFCPGCERDVSPPDLSECTHLEVQCPHSAMRYFFLGLEGIFNAEEIEYIRSCNIWIVKERDVIKAFAEDVSQGTFQRIKQTETSPGPKIICYRGDTRITSLEVHHERVTVDDFMFFRCPQGLPDLTILEPPEIQWLKPRLWCALSIRKHHVLLGNPYDSYPAPSRWCDAIVENLRQQFMSRDGGPRKRSHSDSQIAMMFRCLVASESEGADVNEPRDEVDDAKSDDETVRSWVSDYAMNPNCKPDSPGDMVLLFEAKTGWNQHSGPELFTFVNHDPKGGCVLLNDQTVKFIRTKEELQQLRWK
ncbi:MAG: hypothetical protein WBC05_14340 [Sedimentisphaerales bacterium]